MKGKKAQRKKLLTFGLIGVLCAATIYGAWALIVSDGFTGFVTSDPNLISFDVEFEDLYIDATNHVAYNTTMALVTSYDVDTDASFWIEEIKTDIADDCEDYEDDVYVQYVWEGDEIADGDMVTMLADQVYEIVVNVMAAENSCPQELGVTISLEPV